MPSITDPAVPVELGFLPAHLAEEDPRHPGLLRASADTPGPYADDRVELHRCAAIDLDRADTDHDAGDGLDLLGAGFDTVDLTPLADLQGVLTRVREAGALTDADADAIRASLRGATLVARSGLVLHVVDLAGEGLFLRAAGPNRLRVVGPVPEGMNGHGAATSVHADQDVRGTPLRQLMGGRAPTTFHHDSPGARHDATLVLANVWIPLQQVVQPLVLADGRTIDRRRHQVAFGLATETFLDRDDDMAVNDIWNFLHHDEQRWYLRSELDQRRAYVFNTLSTPHGAGVLPGEDVAERCWRSLERAEAAVAAGNVAAVAAATRDLEPGIVPDDAPAPLRDAIDGMAALLRRAGEDPAAVCAAGSGWLDAARAARDRVVRRSVELRLVVSVAAPS